jgi:hypothetical protein
MPRPAGPRLRLCRRSLRHRHGDSLGCGRADRRREAAAGREGHPGPRLHRHDRDVNAVEAWLGTLPGHLYANVRQPPISTLNLAHMIPLSAVWAGPERDEHFQAPPLLLRQNGRLDPVPVIPACRRRRPHAGRRSDRRRQVGAAGADGACSSAATRTTRSSPSISAARSVRRVARDGRRLARSRRRAHRSADGLAETSVSLQPLAGILIRRSAPGPPTGSSPS